MNAEAVAEDHILEEDKKVFVEGVYVGPKWWEILPDSSNLQTADIGCWGDGRLATEQRNSLSAFQLRVRVADSLQGWIKEGLCLGPMDRKELPWDEYM